MALFRGVQDGQLDQTARGSNQKPSNPTLAMVGGKSTCLKTKFGGSVSGSSHENQIQLARSRSATLRRRSVKILLDLDEIHQDPASSPHRCCSISFDQNRHCLAILKPNQTVFSSNWRRVRFPVIWSGQIGFELGTNPTQTDQWIGLALSCMARKPLSSNLECSHLIWLRNWRIGNCKSTTSQILLACAFSLLHLSSTHAS